MNKGYVGALLAFVGFVTATASQAAVHRVYPGQSIQGAIDAASPGDTVVVEPGIYQEVDNGRYGLRIQQDNIRLIGKVKKGQGDAGKVRLLQNEDQETGVYAAPSGCDYDVQDDTEEGQECRSRELQGFYIRGFSVEEFPVNGIQTRWVNDFEFVRNASVNNLNNGIYPTLSANGLVRNNESYGSLDTAMWVAGSENVRVIGNKLHSSVIGFEITVSNEVQVTQNEMYNNVVGVGLFHPNGAGNPPLPVMANWVIEQNDIYDNNLYPNPAPENTFQSLLPSGIGVLAAGVSDHVIAKNNVEDNDYVGIALLGWCTALDGSPRACDFSKPDLGLKWPPQANNNLISQNYLSGNGGAGGGPLPPVDLLYGQPVEQALMLDTSGNCYRKNKPKNGFTYFSFEPDGELPTDGC
jgi:parallel beta-helix repeat protein